MLSRRFVALLTVMSLVLSLTTMLTVLAVEGEVSYEACSELNGGALCDAQGENVENNGETKNYCGSAGYADCESTQTMSGCEDCGLCENCGENTEVTRMYSCVFCENAGFCECSVCDCNYCNEEFHLNSARAPPSEKPTIDEMKSEFYILVERFNNKLSIWETEIIKEIEDAITAAENAWEKYDLLHKAYVQRCDNTFGVVFGPAFYLQYDEVVIAAWNDYQQLFDGVLLLKYQTTLGEYVELGDLFDSIIYLEQKINLAVSESASADLAEAWRQYGVDFASYTKQMLAYTNLLRQYWSSVLSDWINYQAHIRQQIKAYNRAVAKWEQAMENYPDQRDENNRLKREWELYENAKRNIEQFKELLISAPAPHWFFNSQNNPVSAAKVGTGSPSVMNVTRGDVGATPFPLSSGVSVTQPGGGNTAWFIHVDYGYGGWYVFLAQMQYQHLEVAVYLSCGATYILAELGESNPAPQNFGFVKVVAVPSLPKREPEELCKPERPVLNIPDFVQAPFEVEKPQPPEKPNLTPPNGVDFTGRMPNALDMSLTMNPKHAIWTQNTIPPGTPLTAPPPTPPPGPTPAFAVSEFEDPEVPLTAPPETEEEFDFEEPEIPLAAPPEVLPEYEFEEPNVPLGDLPQTGVSILWVVLLITGALILSVGTVLAIFEKRRV